jgi:uncharacterized membrane protein
MGGNASSVDAQLSYRFITSSFEVVSETTNWTTSLLYVLSVIEQPTTKVAS